MIAEVPNLLLVPFDNNSKEIHIVQNCDVPTDESEFLIYVKGSRITAANTLILNFKILSPLPFY